VAADLAGAASGRDNNRLAISALSEFRVRSFLKGEVQKPVLRGFEVDRDGRCREPIQILVAVTPEASA
jgi:hypothetical protein